MSEFDTRQEKDRIVKQREDKQRVDDQRAMQEQIAAAEKAKAREEEARKAQERMNQRDDSPPPSAPSFDPGGGFVDQGGGGEFGPAPAPKSIPDRGRGELPTPDDDAGMPEAPTPSPGFTAPTKPGQSPRGSDSGGGGDGGCFLKGTQVTMADGSTKAIEQVDLGDNVAKGGKVFATGKFLVDNLHDYKGIKVSGSHMVYEDNKWLRVKDSKHGKSLGDDEHVVYVFGSENRRILINDILFTDYFEVKEQEKLVENEKYFFKNWKKFSNEYNESNVNILNASQKMESRY